MTRRSLMTYATALVALARASTVRAAEGSARKVFEHDLPNVSIEGWSVTAVEVSYPPGGASGAHRHPGITIAYVLEGEIRSKVGDDPERTFGVGQMFLESPGQLHAVSRNASDSQPARLLALLLSEKGKPTTLPAD
jgi:quercetin dioxygenase-like cupin family protein